MFESPWILLSVGVALFCIAAIYRNARPEKARWWQLFIPVAVIGAAFAVDYFFVTDLEKINRQIITARDAVVNRTPQVIINMIDDDYSDSRRLDKQIISSKCRQYLNRPFADRIRINSNVINITGSTATADINATLHMNEASEYAQYAGLAVVEAQIKFIRKDGQWLVCGLEIVKINNNEPPGW